MCAFDTIIKITCLFCGKQKQLETPSPCRGYAASSGFSTAQLASQGSPTAQAAKIGSQSQQRKAELFSRFDVKETSFHVYTGRIDLHLCDDASPGTSLGSYRTMQLPAKMYVW